MHRIIALRPCFYLEVITNR